MECGCSITQQGKLRNGRRQLIAILNAGDQALRKGKTLGTLCTSQRPGDRRGDRPQQGNHSLKVRFAQGPMNGQRRAPRAGSPAPTRKERSLGTLCSKFLRIYGGLAVGAPISLDESAVVLGVERRRLYDITNILEALDVLERSHKSRCAPPAMQSHICYAGCMETQYHLCIACTHRFT